MATMYTRKSRLTSRQQSKLIEHFVAGSTARATAEIVGVHHRRCFHLHREPFPAQPFLRRYQIHQIGFRIE